VAEVLVEFTEPVASEAGDDYIARACGGEMPDGMWQGWLEFLPIGEGDPIRSGRETTQPNRTDTVYWATGLTPIYLEGALHRALTPLVRPPVRDTPAPIFDGPAPNLAEVDAPDLAEVDPNADSILNPFSVYRKGETLLRKQLSAFSSWHLVNIIRNHRLSTADQATLDAMPPAALIELIVHSVKAVDAGASR